MSHTCSGNTLIFSFYSAFLTVFCDFSYIELRKQKLSVSVRSASWKYPRRGKHRSRRLSKYRLQAGCKKWWGAAGVTLHPPDPHPHPVSKLILSHAEHTRNRFHRTLSIRGRNFRACSASGKMWTVLMYNLCWAYEERILSHTVHTRNEFHPSHAEHTRNRFHRMLSMRGNV